MKGEIKTVSKIRIAAIMSNGEVEEEITLEGRNAMIIFESVKIAKYLETKVDCMSYGEVLDIVKTIA